MRNYIIIIIAKNLNTEIIIAHKIQYNKYLLLVHEELTDIGSVWNYK